MRIRLLVGFILFALIATALLIVPIGLTLEVHESTTALDTLKRDTKALSTLLSDPLRHGNFVRATKLAKSYAYSTGRQILVVDDKGVLIATRAAQARDRTLLKVATSARRGESSGQTVGNKLEGSQFFVAVPLTSAVGGNENIDHVVLVVTDAVVLNNSQIHKDWRNLILFALLMLSVAFLFGLIISGSLVRPLRRIGTAVEAIGNGALDVRAPSFEGPRELRRLAGAINSTTVRLVTLLRAQRAFVEDASHQLRTPLTALQLQLENLQVRNGPSSPEDLDGALAEVARLNRLVNSLLVLARFEATTPELTIINVRDAVLERAKVWAAFADELDLQLETSVPPMLTGLAIAGAIEQILDNLLSNAFDATPEGGRITIEASLNGDAVEMHVIDNGQGLSVAERSLALGRFWRGRNNNEEGSGLGLAIVDQLTRLSGGSIELRETEGGGIDATVQLRRA